MFKSFVNFMVISDTVGWTFSSGSLLYTYLQANPKPHHHHPKWKSQKLSTHNQCCAVICLLSDWQFRFFKKFKIKEPPVLVFSLGVGDSESEKPPVPLIWEMSKKWKFSWNYWQRTGGHKGGVLKFSKEWEPWLYTQTGFFGGDFDCIYLFIFKWIYKPERKKLPMPFYLLWNTTNRPHFCVTRFDKRFPSTVSSVISWWWERKVGLHAKHFHTPM